MLEVTDPRSSDLRLGGTGLRPSDVGLEGIMINSFLFFGYNTNSLQVIKLKNGNCIILAVF